MSDKDYDVNDKHSLLFNKNDNSEKNVFYPFVTVVKYFDNDEKIYKKRLFIDGNWIIESSNKLKKVIEEHCNYNLTVFTDFELYPHVAQCNFVILRLHIKLLLNDDVKLDKTDLEIILEHVFNIFKIKRKSDIIFDYMNEIEHTSRVCNYTLIKFTIHEEYAVR